MPISLEQGLVFVRIPNEMDFDINNQLNLEDDEPHGVQYYIDNYQGAFTKTKKFCVIRNPWDRFVFFFEEIKNRAEEEILDYDLIKDKTFAEFVNDIKENRDSYKNPCWLPQTAWIWSEYGPIINHIFLEDPECLRQPQLTSLKAQFKKILNLDVELGEINREEALRRRSEHYTPELVEIVSEMFKHDIEIFSYVYDTVSSDENLNLVSD